MDAKKVPKQALKESNLNVDIIKLFITPNITLLDFLKFFLQSFSILK